MHPIIKWLKNIVFSIMNFSIFSPTNYFKYQVKKKDIRIVMTMVAKNESHILEENLIFHHAMGIDGFILTDNNSEDNTREIMEKYQKKGWVLEIIDAPEIQHFQKERVDKMIKKATVDYGADWVINSDADEFWSPTPGTSIKEVIKKYAVRGKNVLMCYCKDIIPETQTRNFWENYFYIFQENHPSVMHATKDYVAIAQGNHNVKMKFKHAAKIKKEISIYHYRVLSFELFEKKVIRTGTAYSNYKGVEKKKFGSHIRKWYQHYLDGNLRQEYDKIIQKENWIKLKKSGKMVEDKTIYDFFKKNALKT